MFVAYLKDYSRAGVLGMSVAIDEHPHETNASALLERLFADTLAELSWAKVEDHGEFALLNLGDADAIACKDMTCIRNFINEAINAI
jgi:hypothetical protein